MNIPEVTDTEIAFGTINGLPADKEIPEVFWSDYKDKSAGKWRKLFEDCFFLGLKELDLTPKEGIDPDKAWRHVRALMRSWHPKHEHKTAGCAYLMSQYFSDAKWEANKPT